MNKAFVAISLAACLLAGCAMAPPQPTGFYWGNYSRTLYAYDKDPNPGTLNAHRQSLLDIIDQASRSNGKLKVPPGVYAELGKLDLDQGKKDDAVKWFKKEQQVYPESAVLMKTLIDKAERT